VLLSGDLGTGKTFLVKSIGDALGITDMRSPTFVIESVHLSPNVNFPIIHADLYRLDDPSGTVLQLEEYTRDGAAVLVEWGERWASPPARGRWNIDIRLGGGPGEECRLISMSGYGVTALGKLSDAYARLPDAIIAGGARSCP
jgi:tRNA threonylcarbamoyl adenosine modification protein YjeE